MKRRIMFLSICLSVLLLPQATKATTLKEYEDAVAKYTAELKEKEAKIAKSEEEVAQVKKNIASIENQITQTQNEINTLQREIEESNEKIIKKTEESKKIMEYYQIANGDNAYLEYAFGASSITDMIYRMSVVEQLTEYNDLVMKELKQLINENNQKKAALSEKKKSLSALKLKLQSEKERIEQEITGIRETVPDTKGQIKLYQDRVNYYKSKGCKSNDIIGVTCDKPKKVDSGSSNVAPGALVGSNGFRFPVDGGRVNHDYGAYFQGVKHKGIDILRGCGAPIHPVAAGRVYYVGNTLDVYHAYMILIVHNYNGRLVFSQYAHVQPNIPVRVGQDVDINTTIAYLGSTGNSTGCHLHLEMSAEKGWGYNANYREYQPYIKNPFTYIPRP